MSVTSFDRSVLKVNQVLLMGGIVAGYIVALWRPQAALVLPLLALMMLLGVVSPALNLPRRLYLSVLKPRGIVRPRVVREDPAPHRFAQLVGAVFLVAASVSAALGAGLVAWTLGWIVAVLALLNFAFDICVGCIMYAQLVRLRLLPLRRTSAA